MKESNKKISKAKLKKLEKEFREFMSGYKHFTPEMIERTVEVYMSAFTTE
jgi:hypothetical protein